MQHAARMEMNHAIASHFLLNQTEVERLNIPVGVRGIAQSLHSFIHLVFFEVMGGRKGRRF